MSEIIKPANCVVCGRSIGGLQSIWSDDPVICSEACAWSRTEGEI